MTISMSVHGGSAAKSRPLELAIAFAFIAFSVLFIAVQWMHPDPFQTALPGSGQDLIAHFNNQPLLHWAHLIEFLCAPLLMVIAVHFYGQLSSEQPKLSLLALMVAGMGTFMLAGNKAALCLTLSAFDTLDDAALQALVPGLEVIANRTAHMAILWGIPMLPLGFFLFSVALLRSKTTPKWIAGFTAVGTLMLANPEIQIVNTIASAFLAAGLVPYGLRLIQSAD